MTSLLTAKPNAPASALLIAAGVKFAAGYLGWSMLSVVAPVVLIVGGLMSRIQIDLTTVIYAVAPVITLMALILLLAVRQYSMMAGVAAAYLVNGLLALVLTHSGQSFWGILADPASRNLIFIGWSVWWVLFGNYMNGIH